MRWAKFGGAVFAFLLVLAAGVFYLFYTTSGVHFLLGSISRLTSARISSTDLRGHLAGQVSISGLKIRLPETTISATKIILSCSPSGLLLGRFDIITFTGEDVEVVSTGPEKEQPLSFIPPSVPRLVAALEGRIRTLRIDNLRYGRSSGEVTLIDLIKGHAEWHRGDLSIQDLIIKAPAGQISGRVDIGFYRPLLKSDLWIDTKEDWANLNRLLIRTDLKPSFDRGAMTGVVAAWAYKNNEGRVSLEADLSASRRRLDVRSLRLVRPGHEGLIRMYGRIATDKVTPSLTANVEVKQFPLQGLAPGVNGALTGKASIDGTTDVYSGRFTISNTAPDWRAFKMDGRFRGDRRQVTAEIPTGEWLGGRIAADTTINWQKDLQIAGNLKARGLKTGLVDQTWQGIINSDASVRFHRSASGLSTAALNARLLDSTFRQRPVKGVVDAVYEKGLFRLTELTLKGKGFDVSARGSLAERISFNANIDDLSSLIPDAKGVFSGQGWLRYDKSDLTIGLSATGKAIQYGRMSMGRMEVSANVDQAGAKNLHVEANGQSISYAGVDLNTLRAAIKGKTSDHDAYLRVIGPGGQMQATMAGSYEKGVWKGSLRELKGSDKQRGEWRLESPVALTLSGKRVYVDPLVLQGSRGESISGAVDLQLKPTHGFVKVEWQNMDLSRFDPIMPVSLHMRATGHIFLQWTKGTLEQFRGKATSQGGELRYRDSSVRVSQARTTIDWTAKGLKGSGQGLSARFDARLNEEGLLEASADSPAAPRMGLPDNARVSARWSNVDIDLIQPLLPARMGLVGKIVGSLEGKLLPDGKVAATIDTRLAQGAFTWRTEHGLTRAVINKAVLQGAWNGEDMRGQMSLELANKGQLRGSFLLPIPASLPIHAVPTGSVGIRIDGQMEEEGMLSAFFPSLVQETKGSVAIGAQVLGTWSQPRFTGGGQLTNAAAYLPTAGIHIKAVSAKIALSENSVNVQEFHAESGPGRIDGSGVITLKNGDIEKYAGRLTGDRFQALHLPDLRLLVSPSLTISGTKKTLVVDGEIAVPQLLIYGPPTEDVIRTSPDVVIVGAKQKQKRKLPIDLEAKVRVVLGDDVRVKMQGIDAKLDGAVLLTIKDVEDISGVGEIRIVKGQYRAYGVELEVTRGRMIFAGPLQKGRLDILAVRKIKGVVRSTAIADRLIGTTTTGMARTAGAQLSAATSATTEAQIVGVQVTGIMQRSRIDLYSNPPLADSDTLSYMVLGRPVSGDAAQASLLFSTAGSLLGGGTGGSVQEQLKKILGLETLEIGTEKVATEQGQVEQTMVRVGRYLAPNLYIGFGRSLFTDEYVITARYSLSKRWEIQTRTGTQTGGDIYYKVEFD